MLKTTSPNSTLCTYRWGKPHIVSRVNQQLMSMKSGFLWVPIFPSQVQLDIGGGLYDFPTFCPPLGTDMDEWALLSRGEGSILSLYGNLEYEVEDNFTYKVKAYGFDATSVPFFRKFVKGLKEASKKHNIPLESFLLAVDCELKPGDRLTQWDKSGDSITVGDKRFGAYLLGVLFDEVIPHAYRIFKNNIEEKYGLDTLEFYAYRVVQVPPGWIQRTEPPRGAMGHLSSFLPFPQITNTLGGQTNVWDPLVGSMQDSGGTVAGYVRRWCLDAFASNSSEFDKPPFSSDLREYADAVLRPTLGDEGRYSPLSFFEHHERLVLRAHALYERIPRATIKVVLKKQQTSSSVTASPSSYAPPPKPREPGVPHRTGTDLSDLWGRGVILGASEAPADAMHQPKLHVVLPTERDILKGRGGARNVHPGNQAFLDARSEMSRSYYVAQKNDKTAIASALRERMKTQSRRFLDLTEDGMYWYVISDNEARKKCCQALRDPPTPKAREAKRARNAARREAKLNQSTTNLVPDDSTNQEEGSKNKKAKVVATAEITDDTKANLTTNTDIPDVGETQESAKNNTKVAASVEIPDNNEDANEKKSRKSKQLRRI